MDSAEKQDVDPPFQERRYSCARFFHGHAVAKLTSPTAPMIAGSQRCWCGPSAYTSAAPISSAPPNAAARMRRSAARRRRRQTRHDPEVIKVLASDHGAGEAGFAGNTAKPELVAAGLTRLAGTFDGAARLPLLPESWGSTGSGEDP